MDAATEKLASDIVLLDLRGRSTVTDFFVLCTAQSDRQLRAIYEEIDRVLGAGGAKLLRREGEEESGWVLLDFGDLVVHVFSPRERAFYQLEKLWTDTLPMVRIQ